MEFAAKHDPPAKGNRISPLCVLLHPSPACQDAGLVLGETIAALPSTAANESWGLVACPGQTLLSSLVAAHTRDPLHGPGK